MGGFCPLEEVEQFGALEEGTSLLGGVLAGDVGGAFDGGHVDFARVLPAELLGDHEDEGRFSSSL